MGNIRPTYIKRVAKGILASYGDLFTDDFDNNKNLVDEYTDVTSKKLRNRIAGYATRYRRRNTGF